MPETYELNYTDEYFEYELKTLRSKPVEKKGFQLEQKHFDAVGDAESITVKIEGHSVIFKNKPRPHAIVPTLNGHVVAELFDWLILGLENEIYPCADTICRRTHDIGE